MFLLLLSHKILLLNRLYLSKQSVQKFKIHILFVVSTSNTAYRQFSNINMHLYKSLY